MIRPASIVLLIASVSAAQAPIDPKSGPETHALFHNLRTLAQTKILFGHQETTLYGIGWKGDANRSDVKSAAGSYPAVYGWDFADLAEDRLADIQRESQAAYDRGGVNTISWHMFNPVTGENFYDKTPAVSAILPGGDRHDAYKQDLDTVARFAKSLRGSDGANVPIIFRLFHEHTGDWFWWGKAHCTKEEFIALWRFTVDYLRGPAGVHNFLYAYSPSKMWGPGNDYFERYPGDNYVDILGLDCYAKSTEAIVEDLGWYVDEAHKRGKIAALTEYGYPDGLGRCDNPKFFTEALLAPLKADPRARGIAYILVWRNLHDDHYWVPFRGDLFFEDFQAFRDDPLISFEDDLPDLYAQPKN